MSVEREEVLLRMHEFYAEDARHHVQMMWEAVKWFSTILLALHGAWWWVYTDKSIGVDRVRLGLTIFAVVGIVLPIICILILRRFYRISLINIASYIKVEEDLNFNIRMACGKKWFPKDTCITYERYTADRKRYNTAYNFVHEFLNKPQQLHALMVYVFLVAMLIGLIEFGFCLA